MSHFKSKALSRKGAPARGWALSLALLAAVSVQACHREPLDLKRLGKPPEFVLKDQEGQPYRYEPASGTIRLVFFGYTSCPDYCPATLSKLQKVFATLPREHDRPEILFISIDPERDTPAVLKGYLSHFSFPVHGLSGSKKDLESVAKSFGAFFRVEKKGEDISVDHSTYVYLVDPEGEVRHQFKSRDPAERIVEGIQALYAEME